jgi:hypothetical protein
MTITVHYDSLGERKSQVVILNVTGGDYRIIWHLMEKEGEEISAYYQTRLLTNDEMDVLFVEIEQIFKEKNIPGWIAIAFEDNMRNFKF